MFNTLSKTQREWAIAAILYVLFILVCVPLIKVKPESWNDYSHAAAIESLVERGTWVINRSPWTEDTGDKIRIGTKYYSDKLPLLSFLGSGVYLVLHRVWNMQLKPDCQEKGQVCAYYWLVLVLIALPAGLISPILYLYLLRVGTALWAAVCSAILLSFATMILPFSLVFNHHVPAALCLLSGLCLLRIGVENKPKQYIALFGAGVLAAVAICLDLLTGVMAVCLLGIALVRFRKHVVFFGLGMCVPILITAFLDYQMIGTLIPPYLVPNGYNYPGSAFSATPAGNQASTDIIMYAFQMLVGERGLYAYNPILLFATVGMVYVALQRNHPLQLEAAFFCVGYLGITCYLASSTDNFGGVAYGERMFIHAIPIVFSFMVWSSPFTALPFRIGLWGIFLVFCALSLISVMQGVLHPWGLIIPPPVQVTWGSGFFPLGLKWNFTFPLE